MVDARVAQVGERQTSEAGDRVIGREHARAHVVEQPAQGGLVHRFTILARS
jgi:hypothetical protein